MITDTRSPSSFLVAPPKVWCGPCFLKLLIGTTGPHNIVGRTKRSLKHCKYVISELNIAKVSQHTHFYLEVAIRREMDTERTRRLMKS